MVNIPAVGQGGRRVAPGLLALRRLCASAGGLSHAVKRYSRDSFGCMFDMYPLVI